MCQNAHASLAPSQPAGNFGSRLLEALNSAGLMLMTSIGHRLGTAARRRGRPSPAQYPQIALSESPLGLAQGVLSPQGWFPFKRAQHRAGPRTSTPPVTTTANGTTPSGRCCTRSR